MTTKMKRYKQKFRDSWLNIDIFKDWLRPVEGNPLKAYCIACPAEITAKYHDILNHRKTKKHVKALVCGQSFVPTRQENDHSENEIDWNKVLVEDVEKDNAMKTSLTPVKDPLKVIARGMNRICNAICNIEAEDSHAMYGKYIINELREIEDPLALKSVMHKINTALYEAQTEQYSSVQETTHYEPPHIMKPEEGENLHVTHHINGSTSPGEHRPSMKQWYPEDYNNSNIIQM